MTDPKQTVAAPPISANDIWHHGTGSNDELIAILTSHGVITDPDEQRAYVLWNALIQWRNVAARDVAEKYQAVKAELEALREGGTP